MNFFSFLCAFLCKQEAVSCMESESDSIDAVYVRGLCSYTQGDLNEAIDLFEQVLTLVAVHCKAKVMQLKAKQLKVNKEKGNFRYLYKSFGIFLIILFHILSLLSFLFI